MNEKLKTTKEVEKTSRFAMTEDDDMVEEIEEDGHVHVEGCCSCHSNIGK